MDSVQFTLTFGNSVEELWDAWTKPEMVSKWFGSDPNGKVIDAKLDVRIGGNYSVTFQDSDGTEHTCSGIYSEVTVNKSLKFTWEWKSEPGHATQVEVSFRQMDGKVEMNFVHSNLGENSAHQYQQGWGSTFEKLRKVMTE